MVFFNSTFPPTKVLKETRLTNRVTDESVATDDSTAFVLRTSAGDLTPDHFKVAKTEVVAAGPETAEVRVDLTSPELDVCGALSTPPEGSLLPQVADAEEQGECGPPSAGRDRFRRWRCPVPRIS